jgi:hypothetical protein
MLGDAFSPYLIGALADTFKPLISPGPGGGDRLSTARDFIGSAARGAEIQLTPAEYDREFRALEYSLFSCCFFQVCFSSSI